MAAAPAIAEAAPVALAALVAAWALVALGEVIALVVAGLLLAALCFFFPLTAIAIRLYVMASLACL